MICQSKMGWIVKIYTNRKKQNKKKHSTKWAFKCKQICIGRGFFYLTEYERLSIVIDFHWAFSMLEVEKSCPRIKKNPVEKDLATNSNWKIKRKKNPYTQKKQIPFQIKCIGSVLKQFGFDIQSATMKGKRNSEENRETESIPTASNIIKWNSGLFTHSNEFSSVLRALLLSHFG